MHVYLMSILCMHEISYACMSVSLSLSLSHTEADMGHTQKMYQRVHCHRNLQFGRAVGQFALVSGCGRRFGVFGVGFGFKVRAPLRRYGVKDWFLAPGFGLGRGPGGLPERGSSSCMCVWRHTTHAEFEYVYGDACETLRFFCVLCGCMWVWSV
jgi:hypothetical protein